MNEWTSFKLKLWSNLFLMEFHVIWGIFRTIDSVLFLRAKNGLWRKVRTLIHTPPPPPPILEFSFKNGFLGVLPLWSNREFRSLAVIQFLVSSTLFPKVKEPIFQPGRITLNMILVSKIIAKSSSAFISELCLKHIQRVILIPTDICQIFDKYCQYLSK